MRGNLRFPLIGPLAAALLSFPLAEGHAKRMGDKVMAGRSPANPAT
jgi:hypothetical protein